MIAYDSSKVPDVRFNSHIGRVFWVECDVCLYDGEWETNVTLDFALRKLKEHNHYPELMNERIQAIEKELK